MQRKSLFYVINLIVPTFLLSFLTVCVFYLPTGDGEKITLSLGILFALVVFFLLIAKIIPPTNIVVPLISKYLLFTFIMNILSVFNTCIVVNLYFQNHKLDFMHPWLRVLLFKLLPLVLFIKRPALVKLNVDQQHSDDNVNNFKTKKKISKSHKQKSKINNSNNNSPIIENIKFDLERLEKTNRQTNKVLLSDSIRQRSNLYDFEKIKNYFQADNQGIHLKENALKKNQQQQENENYISIDNI